jgi:hypothetical protein
MTEDAALEHLRNVLCEKNPNLEGLVHTTERRLLGQASARGRAYDGSIAGHLARTFLELTRDTMNSALEEAKRIFVNDSKVRDSGRMARRLLKQST